MIHPIPVRQPAVGLRLSELMGALSHALDLTEGQPPGHCVRSCWIGMHVGRELGLPEAELWDLYYTLLLKDLGCSSNAARICSLYQTDDLTFKRDFKTLDGSLPQVMRFVFSHAGAGSPLFDRLRLLVQSVRTREASATQLVQTRCQRGAAIARQLRFSDRVADGIASLDEHWDGGGEPIGLRGTDIPMASRIALLSQVVDVFRIGTDPASACEEVQRRSGTWLDPRVVAAFERVARSGEFWATLASADIGAAVFALEPGQFQVAVDDDYLDAIAVGFGQVIDAKSPYTSGHSTRVADCADAIAREVGVPEARRRWLRRGALLHDLGKLGVSNTILDKPGALDPAEWEALKQHAAFTEEILSRIGPFQELARMAGAHHERLDGTGYPRGLAGDAISLETRIVTTADIFDALTSARPYREAMPVARALEIMAVGVGTTLDPACFAALVRVTQAP